MPNSINTNPWLGLTSYEFEDSYKFFGRSAESDQLSEAITNNSVTVIYGSSGSGKTSILKAGVFPKLQQEYYLPVYIRLHHSTNVSYARQILNSIEYTALSNGIDIEKTCDFNYPVNDDDFLWVYLHSHIFWRKDNYPVIPLIVIDQFEEIFTLNQNTNKISNFFRFVDEFYDNLPPSAVKNIIESSESYIPFINEAKYKLVLSLREDFLARLEDYSHDIPILRKNRFGLKSMNGQQAFDVITKPIPDLVDDMVALKIIRKISGHTRDISNNDLSGISVETSILSLFCSELFKRMEDQSMNKITDGLVDSTGDNIIEDYYTNTMKFVSNKTARYIEDNLLTKSGFRNTIALEDAIDNGVEKYAIEMLQNRRLIKIEIINGTERIEFTHDILCKVAKDKRDLRKKSLENKDGVRYFFDGLLCYSMFILTFWCLWDTTSGIGKLVLIFPTGILLTHITHLLLKAKDKKAVALGFISSLFNFITLPIISIRNNDFADFFENVLYINDAFVGIYTSVFIIFFVLGPVIIAVRNLIKINNLNNSFTWKEIFTLQCYKKYPDLVRIESNILFPVILLICSLIISSYSNIWYSLIVLLPFCLFIFSKLYTLFGLEKVLKKHRWLFYLFFSLSLLILFGGQYIFVLKNIMFYGSLGINLALTLLFIIKYTTSDYSLTTKIIIAVVIWFISFFIFPIIIIGSNILV